MAPGLPDRVDCAHLADESAVLERVYPLGELPRLQDLLEDTRGSVRASFAFAKLGSGRVGATVTVESDPRLVCQRCMQGFTYPAAARSEIEFSTGGSSADAEREVYSADGGLVSLRELAEEELLLALPIVPMHPPQDCDWAPIAAQDEEISEVPDDRSRPFAALQALLKKT